MTPVAANRVVLDTNYFRSLRAEDLRPLRERGLAVSVSTSAFYETWAAAARAGDPKLLIAPAMALSEIVDLNYPIAASGGELMWRFTTTRGPSDGARVRQPYLAWSSRAWHLASTGNVNEASMMTVGLEVDAYLSTYGRSWQAFAIPWPRAEREAILKKHDPRKAQERLVAHLTGSLAGDGYRASLVRRRLDAFYQVVAFQTLNAARGATEPTENDLEDIQSLMHLAESAFLLTHDNRFIRAVDESGTYQRPWVLRLSDFRRALPPGRPWGRNARLAAARFTRQACEAPCGICGGR
jgi:hypothetical protein